MDNELEYNCITDRDFIFIMLDTLWDLGDFKLLDHLISEVDEGNNRITRVYQYTSLSAIYTLTALFVSGGYADMKLEIQQI